MTSFATLLLLIGYKCTKITFFAVDFASNISSTVQRGIAIDDNLPHKQVGFGDTGCFVFEKKLVPKPDVSNLCLYNRL